MLESYITPILMSYVDKYIKNLKPSDLNLSLWGGDVSLTNLELNLHALEKEINFPVTFLSGKIHELHIHVPWTKLYYEPAVITINTIECVLKLKENNFTAEGVDEATEIQQADIKPTSDTTAPQTENEKTLPPGYVQSLLNKVIYNLTVKVNNFILKYVEDDIVLSINVKSAEFHSANENWVKAFVDVAAPDWILHKMCNISDLTVCLDRRNASGIIEMYQDPLAYKCNLSCRMQVYYDKEGFHLPLEKNLSVYCECLEVSITDQQLPLLLRLLKLGLSLYYGTLDLPGCEPLPHCAKEIINKKGQNSNSGIMSQLPSTFSVETDTEFAETGWLSWAYSMVPGLTTDQKTPDASLTPLVSRFGVYISQASLSFKITEPISEGNFLGAQRFVFKPILTLEASGVAQEMITRGSSFFDFQMGVTSVTGWLVDACVCKNQEKVLSDDEDGNTREPEEELFLRVAGKDVNVNKGIAFLKGSLFDLESNSTEQPQFIANAEEFLRKNSEANVLSRFGAMFFEYLYTVDVESNEDNSYYESTPAVKDESYQRIIVGPSMLQITSGVVHRMEMVMKLSEDDANVRKEKDEIFYDDFVEDQLLSGNVSHRHMHVTVLDSSLVIMMSDHVKSAQTQSAPALSSEGTLCEIQEEEKESNARHSAVTTGCVFQVERLDLQKTSPMFPKEMVRLIKDKKGSKTLLQHAHSNMFAKVFGFQVGVSKHDIDVEDPMILNILPACNMSLFAKQSLVSRQLDGLSDIEARFELASLSLNITKPQLVLLQDIHQSWSNSILHIQNSLSGSSLIQDVFHPSAKQGGKIPVLIEAFIQDIKVQLHMTSEEISSSGSLGSIKATVMSLSGETAENTPVLYGPLITADIYNGECFKIDEDRSFRMKTLEPWLAFTVKIPLVAQNGNLTETRPQSSGAILLKCNGTVINLDPVLFTWLAYYPRMSPVVDTSSRSKQSRKAVSHTRSVSAVTPRKKSYARGHISPSHPRKKKKRYSQQRKRQESVQETGQDFDGWVWEKLPLLASVVIQVDVERVVFFAPATHLAYDNLPADCYDIPQNFIRQLHKRHSTPEPMSGLVLSLPALKIRSSGHQDLAICHDILRHPLTLPPRDRPETLPWILTADHASVFTVLIGGDKKDIEVYFVLNPMCCRAMLASAKTSHSGNVASQSESQKATLDFVLHTDFNPLTMNCSKKQVDLLFQLYSNAVQLTSSVSANASFNENESLHPARSTSATVGGQSRTSRRTNSITSSSGFDVVDDESVSSESTPKLSVTSLETPTTSPSLVHVSLWVQWTLPKLSFNIFGNDSGSDLRVTTELEDWSASFDYQNGHFKAQCKVGNLSITHYEIGSSGQWTTGPGGGTILARQDSLSSSLSKVHDNNSDDSDPGRHGFLYVEYTASSVAVPSFKAAFEHDDVFQNSFGYSQDVHVTIQPFDFILWCPLLYTVSTVFHTFISLQSDSVGKRESQGVPLLDPSIETYQSLTNLPEVNLKLRGFRVVVPSCIEPRKLTGKQNHSNFVNNSDLFTIQASSLLLSSRLENPISRLVLDKKLSKALTAFARSRRGSAAERGFGDTQYKIEVKGLRIWSGCWEELCRMLPNQDTSRVERDLLEQNPALEWNTYSGQDRSSALVIPVISDLDIKCIVAPPISLTTSSKFQRWSKPIFGLSFEVNLITDVECFISKSQVQLMQTILKENIMNSGLSNDDVTSDVTTTEDTPTALSHPPQVAASEEKLDSGIGSECSHKNRHVIKTRDSKPEVQEMECLFTAGGLSAFVYEHFSTGEAWTQLVPVVRVSFMQPAFNCTRRADCDTIQISCFDISLAKCKSNTRSADETQLVPSSQDYDVIWFRTGDGSPDKHTELSPAFVNFTCKLYPFSPADLKLDFGRPIWIDVDLGLLARLKDFTTDLNMQETKLDSNHRTNSDSEMMNIVRSVAISTDYVAITATAGQDMEIDPVVKVSCSSMNLGVSLKADEREDFCQRIAANLHLCALTISTSIDDKLRSFLLPYDASIDLELFCSSPSISQDTCCVSAVKEIFIWLDSGLLQVNFGQEHLRCMNIFTQNIMAFINTHFGGNTDDVDAKSGSLPDPASTVHRSDDDLRTGPFKYVMSAASDARPNPYEIVFSDESLPTMTWRYPEPRALCGIHIIPVPFTTFTSYPSPVMEEDRLLPCILRYWNNIQKSYVEHSTFYISENTSTDVALCNPVTSPLSEVIAASEWQVVANIAMTSDDSELYSDDDESSMFSERSNIPSPISATSLAACMKVDSIFCSNLVPKLSVAATVNTMQLTVYNHMENMHSAIAEKFKGYTLQDEIPKSQEYLRVMAENSTIIIKSWPTNTLQCLVWSNAHADVLDYRELRWKSLLSPVDLTLVFVKNQNMQKDDETVPENSDDCSLDVSCGDIVVDASQSRIHTMSGGLLAWQDSEDPVLSHFIICNNTNHAIKFGQDGTEESVVLRSKELTFYSWLTRNDICHQKLHLCLDGESRWCEAFGIDSPGVTNRAVQFSLHTATVIVEVKKKSGLQREVIIHSSHVVQNYTSHDVEVQLLQNPALIQVTSPALQVLHNIIVPSQSTSPSYVISHGGLAGIRVRLHGETTWSGTLPIEDQLPNFKQHCVVQMLGTKEFKNFYIWYNAVCVDSLIGQIEISFSPLFIVKNYLPQTIQLRTVSASGDVTTTHDAPGEAEEHQLFDLPPDSWHYVTFKLPDAKVSSNPSVPLNTTLHELTDKVKRGDDSEEMPNSKWPYSSNSWKTSTDPYLKPVESTLVRHVQSSQDDMKSDQESNNSDLSCVELQCQILNKWSKLWSILLEVKPWGLFENKSCVTLHLKDETGKSIFDVKPGQVISPTKLKFFRVGVLPQWLDEISWSDSISLVDGDHSQTPVSSNSLQQYGQLKCVIMVPSPSGKKLCSLLLMSCIVKGIRIVTLQETTRIVCSALPRPLLVQPVVVNDVTSKLKETMFSTHTRLNLNTGNHADIVSQGIPFWDLSPETNVPVSRTSDSLCVLIFGIPKSPDNPNISPTSIQWSRPIRVQQGIIRQCLFLQTLDPDPPLAIVVITLIENGLIKVVITEDQVPRMLLTNQCAAPIQFGQCPSNSDKQNAKGTTLSGRDLVVSENLEQYTAIPRLDSNCSVYYEPPELREGFLTKKPQIVPKIRVQVLKETRIKEIAGEGQDGTRTKIIFMPQGWSDAIHVCNVGKTAYNLPGNYRLHVQVLKKTSFLTHVVFSETCSESENTNEVQEGAEVKINCNASIVSICLHDETSWVQHTEVFRINLEDLALSALCSDSLQTHIEMNLADIQIDNQMTDDFYHFPVVLLPLESESRSTKRKEKRTLKPLLNCCLDFSLNKQKTHVHLLSLQLEPLSVFIEDTFLYRLAGLLDSFILPESDRPAEPCGNARYSSDNLRPSNENIPTVPEDQAATHDHFRSETERKSTRPDNTRSFSERNTTSREVIRDLTLASAVVSPVLIDRISIEPVYVLVTFHASVKLFVSANHTPLFFSRFEMTSLFTDPAFLAQLLAVHYAYSALMKVGWIVGSLDIIGSPASFIRSLGQGIADFFYLPYDGLTRGPTAFVTGMTRGMSSFMSHISAGALTSVTNLASSISRNMDRLSFDEQYVRFQEQQRADGVPRRVISGFTHGLSGFMLSVLGAVAGVADQPLQGLFRAESVRDVTSGLITGVGKGLIGVVTKPLGGAMELVSQTGQGILQGTGLGEMPMRIYEAQARENAIGSSSNLKYLWKLLESNSPTDIFAVTVSVLVRGNSHFDATLIMSCDSLMFLDMDDDTILSAFVLKQVDMREDPQHPRAIIVEHHVPGTDTISEVSSFAELSPSNIGPSRDVTNRSSRQSFSENEAVNLTLFMDPVYLRPLLSRFKLLKSGY